MASISSFFSNIGHSIRRYVQKNIVLPIFPDYYDGNVKLAWADEDISFAKWMLLDAEQRKNLSPTQKIEALKIISKVEPRGPYKTKYKNVFWDSLENQMCLEPGKKNYFPRYIDLIKISDDPEIQKNNAEKLFEMGLLELKMPAANQAAANTTVMRDSDFVFILNAKEKVRLAKLSPKLAEAICLNAENCGDENVSFINQHHTQYNLNKSQRAEVMSYYVPTQNAQPDEQRVSLWKRILYTFSPAAPGVELNRQEQISYLDDKPEVKSNLDEAAIIYILENAPAATTINFLVPHKDLIKQLLATKLAFRTQFFNKIKTNPPPANGANSTFASEAIKIIFENLKEANASHADNSFLKDLSIEEQCSLLYPYVNNTENAAIYLQYLIKFCLTKPDVSNDIKTKPHFAQLLSQMSDENIIGFLNHDQNVLNIDNLFEKLQSLLPNRARTIAQQVCNSFTPKFVVEYLCNTKKSDQQKTTLTALFTAAHMDINLTDFNVASELYMCPHILKKYIKGSKIINDAVKHGTNFIMRFWASILDVIRTDRDAALTFINNKTLCDLLEQYQLDSIPLHFTDTDSITSFFSTSMPLYVYEVKFVELMSSDPVAKVKDSRESDKSRKIDAAFQSAQRLIALPKYSQPNQTFFFVFYDKTQQKNIANLFETNKIKLEWGHVHEHTQAAPFRNKWLGGLVGSLDSTVANPRNVCLFVPSISNLCEVHKLTSQVETFYISTFGQLFTRIGVFLKNIFEINTQSKIIKNSILLVKDAKTLLTEAGVDQAEIQASAPLVVTPTRPAAVAATVSPQNTTAVQKNPLQESSHHRDNKDKKIPQNGKTIGSSNANATTTPRAPINDEVKLPTSPTPAPIKGKEDTGIDNLDAIVRQLSASAADGIAIVPDSPKPFANSPRSNGHTQAAISSAPAAASSALVQNTPERKAATPSLIQSAPAVSEQSKKAIEDNKKDDLLLSIPGNGSFDDVTHFLQKQKYSDIARPVAFAYILTNLINPKKDAPNLASDCVKFLNHFKDNHNYLAEFFALLLPTHANLLMQIYDTKLKGITTVGKSNGNKLIINAAFADIKFAVKLFENDHFNEITEEYFKKLDGQKFKALLNTYWDNEAIRSKISKYISDNRKYLQLTKTDFDLITKMFNDDSSLNLLIAPNEIINTAMKLDRDFISFHFAKLVDIAYKNPKENLEGLFAKYELTQNDISKLFNGMMTRDITCSSDKDLAEIFNNKIIQKSEFILARLEIVYNKKEEAAKYLQCTEEQLDSPYMIFSNKKMLDNVMQRLKSIGIQNHELSVKIIYQNFPIKLDDVLTKKEDSKFELDSIDPPVLNIIDLVNKNDPISKAITAPVTFLVPFPDVRRLAIVDQNTNTKIKYADEPARKLYTTNFSEIRKRFISVLQLGKIFANRITDTVNTYSFITTLKLQLENYFEGSIKTMDAFTFARTSHYENGTNKDNYEEAESRAITAKDASEFDAIEILNNEITYKYRISHQGLLEILSTHLGKPYFNWALKNQIQIAYKIPFIEILMGQVTKENYQKIINCAYELMQCNLLTTEQLKLLIDKMLNSLISASDRDSLQINDSTTLEDIKSEYRKLRGFHSDKSASSREAALLTQQVDKDLAFKIISETFNILQAIYKLKETYIKPRNSSPSSHPSDEARAPVNGSAMFGNNRRPATAPELRPQEKSEWEIAAEQSAGRATNTPSAVFNLNGKT